MFTTMTDRDVDKTDRFTPEEMDMNYPPVIRAIIWGHSLQKSRLIEDLNAIRALDLP